MNIRIILFVVVLMSFTLFSCDQKGFFAEKTVVVKKFKSEIELDPELFTKDEVYGLDDIICIDKYVVLSARTDYLFYVYNIEGDSLGAFGKKGQGPRELLSGVYCGQFYIDGESTFMWINDVSKDKMCAIDINKSLLDGEFYIEKTITTIPRIVNCFYSDDSLLIMERMTRNNYNLLIKNLNSNTIIEDNAIYRYPVEDVFGIYQSKWRIKPDGTKYVIAMLSINQLNIGGLLNDQKVSINVYSKMSKLDNVIDKETDLAKMIYYCGVDVSNNYIYVLYMNQPYEDTFVKEKAMEVHVFSWNGEAICKFHIPQYITHFAVNETEGLILGWDFFKEKLFKYKFDVSLFK